MKPRYYNKPNFNSEAEENALNLIHECTNDDINIFFTSSIFSFE